MTEQPLQKQPQPITWPILVVFGVGLLAVGLLIAFLFSALSKGTYEAEEKVIAEEEVIVSAGSDVRAGHGTPAPDYGVEGDLFLNVATGDVYLRGASSWAIEGNLAAVAYAKLMGPQGEAGKPGEAGEAGGSGQQGPAGPVGPAGPAGAPGVAGKDGSDGTTVELGDAAPTGSCQNDDDIFINVKDSIYFVCADQKWSEFKY